MEEKKLDLEKIKFLELESRILSNAPQSTKIKFIEGAMRYHGLTDVEAYRHLKKTCSDNLKKRR